MRYINSKLVTHIDVFQPIKGVRGGYADVDTKIAEWCEEYSQLQLDKRKVTFSDNYLVMMFAYGHQIGMNSVLAIQSTHGPQPMEDPKTDKLRDEMIEFLKMRNYEVN